jgi:hypothetical protein
MLNKYGKWFADWRDETGRRKRKAFPTKRQAAHYAEKMRKQKARGKGQRKEPRPGSLKPGRRPQRKEACTAA